MCRISGYWALPASASAALYLERLVGRQVHGGPDAQGQQQGFSPQGAWALGHNRLAILDLSPTGAQPMRSACGRYWLVFNGELYNYREVRRELESLGHAFTGHSDTEVLLAAWATWGLACLNRFRGMFAFALRDEQADCFYLGRDRLGVKPLYYWQEAGALIWASELKALEALPQPPRCIAAPAVSLYLRQGYIPAPWSIYEGVYKVQPGQVLRFDSPGQAPEALVYYNLQALYRDTPLIQATEAEWLERAEAVLSESFALRLVADVPVGMFLSGGVDSSLVLALLRQKSNAELRSFTIGFEDPQYNEAEQAAGIARHLGSTHTAYYCSLSDMAALLPELPDLVDEPMGDSSIIPTALVSRLAASQVKVSLSADGGDELFGGYTKYEVCGYWYPRLARRAPWQRRALAWALSLVPAEQLESWQLPILRNYKQLSNKIPKLQQALEAENLTDFFHQASSYLSPAQSRALQPGLDLPPRWSAQVEAKPQALLGYLGLIDLQTYLQGDILHKVDRASMRYALEGREPFLDSEIIRLAFSLPDEFKLRGKTPKYLLRQLLRRHLPAEFIDRPKQGFSVPIEAWLKGLLREELRALAEDQAFAQDLGLHQPYLSGMVNGFLQGAKGIHPQFIWFLYVLYRWWQARF